MFHALCECLPNCPRLILAPVDVPAGRPTRTLSYVTLVDLAGSESARANANAAQRLEGSFINKSLLTLGACKRLHPRMPALATLLTTCA